MVIKEKIVIDSFRLAKSDILNMQNTIIDIKNLEEELLTKFAELEQKYSTLEKKKSSRRHKVFVSSKEGKKFHDTNCPFAHNIKAKSKIIFNSKNKALSEGYTPCACTV